VVNDTPCSSCPIGILGGPCPRDRRLCDRPDWDPDWRGRRPGPVHIGPVRPNPIPVDYNLPDRPSGKCCG